MPAKYDSEMIANSIIPSAHAQCIDGRIAWPAAATPMMATLVLMCFTETWGLLVMDASIR